MAVERIQLTCAIYDDGEDHHPPGWLAQAGEILFVVKRYDSGKLAVTHDPESGQSFSVYPNEYTTFPLEGDSNE